MTEPSYQYSPFAGDSAAWDALIAEAPGLNLIQASAYGDAKAATGHWEVARGTLDFEGRVLGAVQTMVRTTSLPGVGMAWVNRGPLALSESASTSAMLSAVKVHFADEKGLYLRVAPMVRKSEWDFDIPGLRITDAPGWSSSMVDLTLSADTLRANLHRKWRNHLNKAERSDIDIRAGCEPELFNAFKDGHRDHLARLGSHAGIDEKLLDAIQEHLPDSQKIMVFHAAVEGAYAGAIAIVRYGKTAEYLAGHNNEFGRANNVGQLLLWTAVDRLRAESCQQLDLGGMDAASTPPGIFEFKDRVNGTSYQLVNELEGGTSRLINKLIRWRVERQRRTMTGVNT